MHTELEKEDSYQRLAALRPSFLSDLKNASASILRPPMAFGLWMITRHRQVHSALMDLEQKHGVVAANEWMNQALVESGRFEWAVSFKG